MIVDSIRADQREWPKRDRFSVGELLHFLELKRPTYYDERKRIKAPDKYAKARQVIVKCVEAARFRGGTHLRLPAGEGTTGKAGVEAGWCRDSPIDEGAKGSGHRL